MSERTAAVPRQVWHRPMVGRRADEEHRSPTVLELFFDLCFVVAVAQAAGELHHAISADHVADGVFGYVLVFFAVWWAWMNFTWFASAYDTDDIAYRLTTLVQIAGALVFAAGVPRAMDQRDFAVTTLGYVIMRLAMVTQWLRAARSDPARRGACLRFAAGVTLVQIGWVARLSLPEPWDMVGFGSAAAVGAGLQVNVDHAVGESHISSTAAAASVTVPVAVFLLAMWVLHWTPQHVGGWHQALAPVFTVAVLLATLTPEAVLATGLSTAGMVVAGILAVRDRASAYPP
jgi:hypothetical protein